MTHLSQSELVDLLEDTLPSSRAAHVEACRLCRDRADALRATLRDTADLEVPDPSPLFWEHFQSRVRDGIARTPDRSAWHWSGRGGWAPLSALLVAVLAVGVTVFGGLTRGHWTMFGPAAPHQIDGATVASVEPSDASVLDAGDSEVWAVLTSAAEDVELQAAHDAGMHVYPATIDRAVQRMSQAELTELGRLLQSELKHSMN